ncbi:MAG TPA: FMN-binding protein [Ornithinibacter sp.]|jgi:uncharacterized protein with FMN-binding domain|nr:FMN-binding protein [Ornithinibacter sp.]HPV90427.1 FMN-binding protein [Ornithinibacter sp.]HQG16320.1 FMN-binding protein [Ornithinibacter sp.]
MRRITLWLLSTISTLVLLFSYSTSTSASASVAASVVAEADTGSDGTDTPTQPDTSTQTPAQTESSAASGSSTSTAARTILGDAIMTRYGNVQVQITVANGAITASEVTQVPWSNGKDQQINGRAVPVLNAEVVDAQSAGIDMVSGATYTSEAYIRSLQSAIDQANL